MSVAEPPNGTADDTEPTPAAEAADDRPPIAGGAAGGGSGDGRAVDRRAAVGGGVAGDGVMGGAGAGERGRSVRRRRVRWVAWGLVVVPVGWAVVRGTGLERGSMVTSVITLTPYAALGAALLGVLLLVARRRAQGVVVLLACAVLVSCVLPRALSDASASSGTAAAPTGDAATRGRAEGTPLRVLALNVMYGQADPRAVVELVRKYRPEVFSALELTPEMVTALDAAGLAELMPYRVLQAAAGASGSGLFAARPLAPREGLFTPVGHNMPAATLTLAPGVPVEVVAVHPFTPLGRRLREWKDGLAALPSASPQVVRVLAGDFNASLDHRALRDVLARGYLDAADQAGKGLTPTWPANRDIPPMITIDHILADRSVTVRQVEILDVPGTDHRGVFADLRLPA
ncbi:endonuclease/exonuclease/phosphatase family protein [Spongiactinospora sp. TRM90649]|uniref:endonuclease/exonuclease/phosphatase family protein n=1 Tax=Spongiactinospora sp. TRM90649 TaxID=3031114 RepID=UPI0023F8EE72|nr:endonuclease/exonuclease/phosphatase family protein [Spongiactinospora sp. TRM90649]MDF5756983.1 endonuclease/exonuclease/phosphatase family protein [Spongiactinospora sp. TRM90649]